MKKRQCKKPTKNRTKIIEKADEKDRDIIGQKQRQK